MEDTGTSMASDTTARDEPSSPSAALVAVASGYPTRPLYVGGSLLVTVYIVGYFGWHVSGHRPLFVLGPGTNHEGPLVAYLVDHVFAGPVEFLSLASETGLLVILLYLLFVGDAISSP